MRDTQGSQTAFGRASRRRSLSLAVLCAGCVLFAASVAFDYDTSPLTPRVEAEPTPAPSAAEPQGPDFSRFTHTNPQHARLPCLLCHQRTDNSARPKRSGHTPCAGCHTQQFAEPASPICTICHTSPPSPALKGFPPLRTFNVRFDHATHTDAGAGARTNCATCHRPERRGVALSIPDGTGAHATCFQCHTPRAQGRSGQDISSCGACHRLGGYARTPETAAAYRVNFSHSPHTAKGLACADCHTVRAGAPQSRQVTSPAPLMHHASSSARSCMTCHDDKRAFGGDDFKDCTRCHRGNAWHF